MNSPINITIPWKSVNKNINYLHESGSNEVFELSDKLFTEAVFADGRNTIKPVLDAVTKCKEELMQRLHAQDESGKSINDYYKTPKSKREGDAPTRNTFNPNMYWKDPCWKQLEDTIMDVFGFRVVNIQPYRERYISKDKEFESKELNAFIYSNRTRYPVEALVTDKGLYDKSRSLIMDMVISLGMIKSLEPNEILAIILHEMGHGIDPALVDIKFLETNILSKYITDRVGTINKDEKKAISTNKFIGSGSTGGLITKIISFWQGIKRLFMGAKKYDQQEQERRENEIRRAMNEDKRQFNRQVYTEAFADNFARMYGYGGPLMSGLQKVNRHYDNELTSRYKKERVRQELITKITIECLRDEHKTEIHRTRTLIREYENDLKDPNIPEEVKKQIRDDKKELESVLYEYLNHFSTFQTRVNNIINDELDKMEGKIEITQKEPEKTKTDVKEQSISEKYVESMIQRWKIKNTEKLFKIDIFKEV